MKNKFGIWLNIVTMCLCVCAIVIGVYAIKNATLTVSGSIGFVSHRTNYDITAKMKGYMTKSGETEIYHSTFENLPVTTTASGDKSIALGEIYFTNEGEGNIVEDIVIELTITNNASYPIEATLGLPGSDILTNVDFTKSQNIVAQMGTTTAQGKTQIMTINMSLANQSALSNALTFNFSVTLKEFERIQHDDTIGYYTTMGSHIVGSGTSQIVKAVRWLPFAKYVGLSNTNADENGYISIAKTEKPVEGGKYYFVSENILDFDTGEKPTPSTGSIYGNKYGVAYANELNSSYYSTKTNYTNFYAQDYLISNVRELLTSETGVQQYANWNDSTGATPYGSKISLLKEYGLQGYTYASITPRSASELHENGKDGKELDAFQNTEKTASDSLWLLSGTELKLFLNDASFDYADYDSDADLKAMTFRGEVYGSWWLRSPHSDYGISGDRFAWSVYSSGFVDYTGVYNALGVRPAFTLTI